MRSILLGLYLHGTADVLNIDKLNAHDHSSHGGEGKGKCDYNAAGTIAIYICIEVCQFLPQIYGTIRYAQWNKHNTEKTRGALPMTHIITIALNVLACILCCMLYSKNPVIYYCLSTSSALTFFVSIFFWYWSREYVRNRGPDTVLCNAGHTMKFTTTNPYHHDDDEDETATCD